MKVQIIETWDYSHWKNSFPNKAYIQTDWNQTLMTMINQVSNDMDKTNLSICVNKNIFSIIETLAFYNNKTNRFNTTPIIIDNFILENDILVSDGDSTNIIKIINY
jgi:hypothetical protein